MTVPAALFAFLSLSKRNGNTCRGYIIWISINRRIQLAQFAYAYFSVLQLKLVSQLSILDENRIWPIHRVTAIQTIVRLFVKLLVLQLNLLYGSFFYIFILMFTKLHQNPTTKLYCRHKNNHSNWRSLYEDQFWF